MASLPLPRTDLPGLAPLLNGDLWARWAADGRVFDVSDLRSCVRYLRLKPETSCRLAIFRDSEMSTSQGPPMGMLLYLFANRDRAQEFHDKRLEGKVWGKQTAYQPFIDHRRAIVAIPFPNDREIPGLRHVYRHHRLKEIVLPFLPGFCPEDWRISKRATRLQVVRYKVGRRVVFQYTLTATQPLTGERRIASLHMKADATETFSPARNKFLSQLSGALDTSAVRVPEVVGIDAERLLTVRPWYSGSDLADRIKDLSCLERAARALAALHAVSTRGPAPPIDDPIRVALSEAEMLATLLPYEAVRIRRLGGALAERLARLDDGDTVLLHGDFHPGQVVFHNGVPMMIDLDRCGFGHAALDLGSFLAHLVESPGRERQVEVFLDAYRSESRFEIDPTELAAGYCLGLLRRCGRPFRDLDSGWPAQVGRRLARLEQAWGELG